MEFHVLRNRPEIAGDDYHFVLSAWLGERTPLVQVLVQGFGWPQFVFPTHAVSAFDGRIMKPGWTERWLRERDANRDPSLWWPAVWEMCDRANESYESGTLYPKFPVTLLPAFTCTNPFREEPARLAIGDCFVCHRKCFPDKSKMLVWLHGSTNWAREEFQAHAAQFTDLRGSVEFVEGIW